MGNLAVAPSGQLAVTDRSGHQAWWVASNGAMLPLAGNGTTEGGGDGFLATETGLTELRGIWFPPDGGVLLCTHVGSQLWWMDQAGVLHLMLDGAPDGGGRGGGARAAHRRGGRAGGDGRGEGGFGEHAWCARWRDSSSG